MWIAFALPKEPVIFRLAGLFGFVVDPDDEDVEDVDEVEDVDDVEEDVGTSSSGTSPDEEEDEGDDGSEADEGVLPPSVVAEQAKQKEPKRKSVVRRFMTGIPGSRPDPSIFFRYHRPP